MDQNGTVVGKTFTLTVGETGKLTNNSTMSATSISLGSSAYSFVNIASDSFNCLKYIFFFVLLLNVQILIIKISL